MILKMTQIHSTSEGLHIGIEYEYYKENEKIASFYAKDRPIVLPMQFEGNYRGENEYKVILEKNDICPEGYNDGMMNYHIKNDDGSKVSINKYDYNYYTLNNELIGKLKYISITPKKEKIFEMPKTYSYQEFTFKGKKYNLYDVRIRGTGMFYCIYKENDLIAMVERSLPKINWFDNYTIYALDDVDVELICLATAHYDYLNFEEVSLDSNREGEISIEMGVSDIEYRKDILDKYDPNFKNKIINMK